MGQKKPWISGLILVVLMTMLAFSLTVIDVSAELVTNHESSKDTAFTSGDNAFVNQTVRVGYVLSQNFMEGAPSEDKKSGYAYEYLQLISYYTNWKYEYVYGNWSTMLHKLETGEIDLLAGISKTPDRDEKVLFPDEAMGTADHYIYVPASTHLLPEPDHSELRGFRIGVNQNSLLMEDIADFNQQYELGLQIITYPDNTARVQAYRDGNIDAITSTNISREPADTDVPIAHIGSSQYYLAVSPGCPKLLKELNQALNDLRSSDPDFPERIQEKYLRNVVVIKELTHDERCWLLNHAILRIGYSDGYEPFCYTDSSGETQGVLPDLLRNIFSSQTPQVSLEFEPYQSYRKMLEDLRKGELDIIMPVLDQVNISEQGGIYQSVDAIEVHMQMIYRGTYEKAQKGRLAVSVRNQSQSSYASYYYPDNEKIQVESLRRGLEAIEKGDADAMIVNSYAASSLLRDNDELRVTPLVQSVGMCFGVPRGCNILVSLLNRGISLYGKENIEASLVQSAEQTYKVTFSSFIQQHIVAVSVICFLIAIAVAVIIVISVYRRQERRLFDYLAHYDSTTSLLNRRSYDETVAQLRERLPEETVVIEIDINGLKQANDTFGHGAGDELIAGTAKCLIESFNEGKTVYVHNRFYAALHPNVKMSSFRALSDGRNARDVQIFRTGGDEFVVILFTTPTEADLRVTRLDETVSNWKGMKNENLSVSTGMAKAIDFPDKNIDGLTKEADRQMYQSKKRYYEMPGHSRRR